jgi:hypothetical protein
MAIVALVMMALSPLSMRRHLCYCQTSAAALVAHHSAGIVALVVMALLPLIHRHLCCCCGCGCFPHDNAIVDFLAIVKLASLPL